MSEDGERIVLTFEPSGQDGDEWLATARTSRAGDAVVVTATGTTRRDALTSVGERWRAHLGASRLPRFDWEGMPAVLDKVRALG